MQKYFSDITQSKSLDMTSKEQLINQFYLNQKLRSLQNSQGKNNSLNINEILKNNSPILFFSGRGQGKTTLALKIVEQFKESQPIIITVKSNNQSLSKQILKQQFFVDVENNPNCELIIIDDFDVILSNNQEIMEISDSIRKTKYKFIYFVNTSIIQNKVYKDWIKQENIQYQYEILQLDKIDVKNYFEHYLPWDECLSNINLSLNLNISILNSVVKRIQNNYNIENALIKIIKLSSIADNLEQETGNAITILKKLKYIFQNQDFSFIRMKNSSFDFLSFHKCNFEGSQMENVDISRCWFISCNLNDVQWHNMVKNEAQAQTNVSVSKTLLSIIFTIDKKFAILAYDNCSLELWHIKASKRIIFFGSNQKRCFHKDISFNSSSKGNLVAICIKGQQLKIKNYQSGKIIRKIHSFYDYYYPIKFSHDSQILAFGNYPSYLNQNRNGMIYLWNQQEGKQFQSFQSHTRPIRNLQFSMDDKQLCFLSKHCFLFSLWNIKDQRVQYEKKIEGLKKVSISPDFRYLVSAKCCQIVIFDVISNAETRRAWNSSVAVTIFSSNGKYLACGLKNGCVTLFTFNQQKGEQLQKIQKILFNKDNFGIHRVKDWNINKQSGFKQLNKLISLSFSSDESYLISGNRKGMIKFHDIQKNENEQLYRSNYFQVAFSPKGKKLAFCSLVNEKVFIINMEQKKLKYEITPVIQNKESLRSITFSFDDQLLAYSTGKIIKIWNLHTQATIFEIKNYAVVQGVIFSPVEHELASYCLTDSTIFIWGVEIQNQVSIKKKINTYNIINSIAYSPCGNFLASSGKYQLCLWDYKSFEIRKQLEVEECGIGAIAFAPSGEIIAASVRFKIILWNIKQQNKVLIIESNSSLLKFSPNGLLLASKHDAFIYIWNISQFSNCNKPIILSKSNAEIDSFDFSADGTMFASSNYEGSIIVQQIELNIQNLEKNQVALQLDNEPKKEQGNKFKITPLYGFRMILLQILVILL